MNAQHTPTPWFDRDGLIVQADTFNAPIIAEVYDPQDRAFIVRACNAHDDLVAALQRCMALLPEQMRPVIAERALAKAGAA